MAPGAATRAHDGCPSSVSGSGSSSSWARSTSGRQRSCPPTHRQLPRGSLDSRGAYARHLARPDCDRRDRRRAHLAPTSGRVPPKVRHRAVHTYRLLAVEMAARADRGTPRHVPPQGIRSRSCETCTSWPRRSPSTERSAESFPGLVDGPPRREGVRRSTSVPRSHRLTPVERAVERIVRDVLAARRPATPGRDVFRHGDAVRVRRVGARDGPAPSNGQGGRYRGDRDRCRSGGSVVREGGGEASSELDDDGASRPCTPQERATTPSAPWSVSLTTTRTTSAPGRGWCASTIPWRAPRIRWGCSVLPTATSRPIRDDLVRLPIRSARSADRAHAGHRRVKCSRAMA